MTVTFEHGDGLPKRLPLASGSLSTRAAAWGRGSVRAKQPSRLFFVTEDGVVLVAERF